MLQASICSCKFELVFDIHCLWQVTVVQKKEIEFQFKME